MKEKKPLNTKAWKTDLKQPKHPPLIANCFKCNREFEIKYVFGYKRYSLKNNWEYYGKCPSMIR